MRPNRLEVGESCPAGLKFGSTCRAIKKGPATSESARVCPTHRRAPHPGAQGIDTEHSEAGSCQRAKEASAKPGVRFLARSKRGTRSVPAWLIGGTRQRRRRFCASGWEETNERAAVSWRSPKDGERHQTVAPSLVTSQPYAQNRLPLCLVPPISHAGMDLGPRFDRARNLTPGLPPSSLAF